jgi:type VI protein secretion system component VasF
MTEFDELLSRLRKLDPITPDPALRHAVQQRGRRALRAGARSAPLASLAVAATVIAYLGWALRFTSALYR